MMGLAYVLFHPGRGGLAEVLTRALAPFEHGGLDRFPPDRLTFDDLTAEFQRLHTAEVDLRAEDGAVRFLSMPDDLVGYLDPAALAPVLAAGEGRFAGRLSDLEPDFGAFVARFAPEAERDPATGAVGQWCNPLGRWDWWDLGGRFDGAISGARRHGARDGAPISSGPSRARALLSDVGTLTGVPPDTEEALTEANIEPVEALLEAAARGAEHAIPSAVVLPPGFLPDSARWLDQARPWAEGEDAIPAAARAALGVDAAAPFAEVVTAAYRAHLGGAVAGVAYHF